MTISDRLEPHKRATIDTLASGHAEYTDPETGELDPGIELIMGMCPEFDGIVVRHMGKRREGMLTEDANEAVAARTLRRTNVSGMNADGGFSINTLRQIARRLLSAGETLDEFENRLQGLVQEISDEVCTPGAPFSDFSAPLLQKAREVYEEQQLWRESGGIIAASFESVPIHEREHFVVSCLLEGKALDSYADEPGSPQWQQFVAKSLFLNLLADSSLENWEVIDRASSAVERGDYDAYLRKEYFSEQVQREMALPALEREMIFGQALLEKAGVVLDSPDRVLRLMGSLAPDSLPSNVRHEASGFIETYRENLSKILKSALSDSRHHMKEIATADLYQHVSDTFKLSMIRTFDALVSHVSPAQLSAALKPKFANTARRRREIARLNARLKGGSEDDDTAETITITPKEKVGLRKAAGIDVYEVDDEPFDDNGIVQHEIEEYLKDWRSLNGEVLTTAVRAAFDRICEQVASGTTWSGIKVLNFGITVNGKKLSYYQYKPQDDRGQSYDGVGRAMQKCRIRFVIVEDKVAIVEVASRDAMDNRDRNKHRGSIRRG